MAGIFTLAATGLIFSNIIFLRNLIALFPVSEKSTCGYVSSEDTPSQLFSIFSVKTPCRSKEITIGILFPKIFLTSSKINPSGSSSFELPIAPCNER